MAQHKSEFFSKLDSVIRLFHDWETRECLLKFPDYGERCFKFFQDKVFRKCLPIKLHYHQRYFWRLWQMMGFQEILDTKILVSRLVFIRERSGFLQRPMHVRTLYFSFDLACSVGS